MGEFAAVALADLLRALALAADDEAAQRRYAALLGFESIAAPPREAQTPREILSRPWASDAVRTEALPPTSPSPPTELWAITCCEPIAMDCTRQSQVETLPAPLTLAECQPRRMGPPPFVPLVRAQRLWPALRHSISDYRSAGIDVHRWVQALARLERVERAPRRVRRVVSESLYVIWDRSDRLKPYDRDYQQLLAQLVKLCGLSNVTLSVVDDEPDAVLEHWRLDRGDSPLVSPPARHGARVVLLTDLGVLAETPTTQLRWQHYARSARADGADVLAWVPHSARQVHAELARELSLFCLDPATGLRRQRGHLHTRAQQDAEHRRLRGLREQLLVLGACCVRMEPELLRGLRALLPQTASEPALESLWWSYLPVVGSSRLSRPLAATQQAAYRRRFSELPIAQQLAVLDLVRRVHAHQGRSTEMQEFAIWDSHAHQAARAKAAAELEKAVRWWQSFAALQEGASTPEGRDFASDVLRRSWWDEVFQRQHGQWLSALLRLSGSKRAPPGLDSAACPDEEDVGHTYQLFQIGATLQWVPDTATLPPHASRLGSPLTFRSIDLTDDVSGKRWRQAPRGQRRVALELAPGHVGCTLTSASHVYTIRSAPRPEWAHEIARDRFGLYADAHIKGDYGTAVQRFRYIEPGTFLMGSPSTELKREPHEGPQHRVTLKNGFWLADTACTQALWHAVTGTNPSTYRGEQRPVDDVSWDDVAQFLRALGRQLPSAAWTLPSEAQWEYACRAGTTTPFSFGASITAEDVNYDSKFPYGSSAKVRSRDETLPVKSLPPNPWGLYEMHGNVWEWCADEHREYSEDAVTDPLGPTHVGSKNRAGRGGSWHYEAWWARSACRYEMSPDTRFKWFGFRICAAPAGR